MLYLKIKNLWDSILVFYPYLISREAKYKIHTEQYPDRISAKEAGDLSVKYKGFLKNNLEVCNGCGECISACPANALQLDSELRSDGTVLVDRFRIDLGRCVFCSICTELCPVGSLTYTREYEKSAISPKDLLLEYSSQNKKDKIRFEIKDKMKMIRSYEVRK